MPNTKAVRIKKEGFRKGDFALRCMHIF